MDYGTRINPAGPVEITPPSDATLTLRMDTPIEVDYYLDARRYRAEGILPFVLR